MLSFAGLESATQSRDLHLALQPRYDSASHARSSNATPLVVRVPPTAAAYALTTSATEHRLRPTHIHHHRSDAGAGLWTEITPMEACGSHRHPTHRDPPNTPAHGTLAFESKAPESTHPRRPLSVHVCLGQRTHMHSRSSAIHPCTVRTAPRLGDMRSLLILAAGVSRFVPARRDARASSEWCTTGRRWPSFAFDSHQPLPGAYRSPTRFCPMSMDRRSGTLGRGWGPAASPSRADITLRALRSNSSSRFDSGFRSGFGDDLGYSTRTYPDQLRLLPRADRAQQSGLPTSSTPGAPGMWTCLQVLGVLGILAGAVWVARRRPLSSSL